MRYYGTKRLEIDEGDGETEREVDKSAICLDYLKEVQISGSKLSKNIGNFVKSASIHTVDIE